MGSGVLVPTLRVGTHTAQPNYAFPRRAWERDFFPYKLINQHGVWYLAGLNDNKLKTFSFSKIENIRRSGEDFSHDAKIEKILSEDDGIWLNSDKIEVVLNISKEVAGYFKRRKLIANQLIDKELDDGGLIISTKVGHLNQVLPIVQYWLPHIRIISPESALHELEGKLREYLKDLG